MTPTHAQKGARRYRYYVSQALLQGRSDAGSVTRVPAHEIEAIVIGALRSATPNNSDLSDQDLIADQLRTITIRAGEIEIEPKGEGVPMQVPWWRISGQRRREIIGVDDPDPRRPMKVEDRSRILNAIATGRVWLDELVSGEIASTDAIAIRERYSERSIRNALSLAFLSPEIVRAIIEGRLPRGIGLTRLTELPSSWAEQHAALGF